LRGLHQEPQPPHLRAPAMSVVESRGSAASCAPLRERLAEIRRAGEGSFDAARSEHLRGCDECKSLVAEEAPELFFSILALERKSEAFWVGFETRVLAAAREQAREPRGFLQAWRAPRFVGLAAAAGLLAVVAVVAHRGGPVPAPWRPNEGGTAALSPAAQGAGADRSGSAARGAALGRTAAATRPFGVGQDSAAPPPVESVSSPTARMVTIQVEDKDLEGGDVVMLVDPRIDI
jgi:hypothetical protein